MVQFKGVQCREARHLGWRHANPRRDVDRDGNPVQSNYIAIVRIKDCRLYKEDGRDCYDPENAPSIPIAYSRTNAGYGKHRTNNRIIWLYDDERKIHVQVSRYETVPFYYVKDGIVYQGAIRHFIRDGNGKIQHELRREAAEVRE